MDIGSTDALRTGERLHPERRDWLDLRDYAAIGDCHGNALVGIDGGIDWCVFCRHDADPVFCRLLDARRGGHFSIAPEDPFRADRRYLDGTNILETRFVTPRGTVLLTDFMPVGRRWGAGAHDYTDLVAPNWLVRRLRCTEGSVRLRLVFRPSRDFAARPVQLEASENGVRGKGVPALFGPFVPEVEGDVARAAFTLGAGERADWVVAVNWTEHHPPLSRVDEFLAVTTAFWREWIAYCRYGGPHAEAVRRSALALKLLTWAPGGSLVAAATTSLPEWPGGTRNWDYRYCWLRDATMSLHALSVLGYSGEAAAFVRFLARCVECSLPEIRILYGIDARERIGERELDHLEGWRGSRPVRVGNGAWNQRQIDVYGEVLDFAWLYRTLGGRLGPDRLRLLEVFVDFVRRHWEEPDHGLWEMRGPPRHHLHGKLMCWVAMDRAVRLFGPRPEFVALRDRIRDAILAHGRDREAGHLLQAFGQPGTDAAVLLAPALGFPLDGETLAATLRAVGRELRDGPFVYRYRGDDGLEGGEGAFLICSFWLVDALLAAGRREEAEELFAAVCGAANDVGLFAEEVDPVTGAFLGNMPQAFTHLALINAAVALELHRRYGPQGLAGGIAGRARRAVGHTFGWRAMLETVRRCRRVGRIRSSKESVLFWP